MSNRLSVEEAAKLMGASPQFVRNGLRQGAFPFGWAFLTPGGKTWSYYISRKKFEEFVGGADNESILEGAQA